MDHSFCCWFSEKFHLKIMKILGFVSDIEDLPTIFHIIHYAYLCRWVKLGEGSCALKIGSAESLNVFSDHIGLRGCRFL